MGLFEISFIGIGLAMDAFAVSICKGLSIKRQICKKAMIISAYFGIFQAIMPLIGYCLGANFQSIVESIDHWIAFILLLILGGKMVIESKQVDILNGGESDEALEVKTMSLLAIATSIDALAVGITFAFLEVNILKSITIIGIITFIICALGVIIGNKFGNKLQSKAQVFGGVILILIGLKTLLTHLGIF